MAGDYARESNRFAEMASANYTGGRDFNNSAFDLRAGMRDSRSLGLLEGVDPDLVDSLQGSGNYPGDWRRVSTSFGDREIRDTGPRDWEERAAPQQIEIVGRRIRSMPGAGELDASVLYQMGLGGIREAVAPMQISNVPFFSLDAPSFDDLAAELPPPILPADLPSHDRYKGVTQPVGDAYLVAEPVLNDWRNGRPVDPNTLRSAFEGLASQLPGIAQREEYDRRAAFEVVGVNARLTWLSQAASRSGISLTPQQNSLAFGASLSLPVGENSTLGGRPMQSLPTSSLRNNTITNSFWRETKNSGWIQFNTRGQQLKGSDGTFRNTLTDLPDPTNLRRAELRQMPDGTWKVMANGTPRTAKGQYVYVVQGGKAYVGVGDEFQGHIDVARGGPVEYAGTIKFGSGKTTKGSLEWWTNHSGHYVPEAPQEKSWSGIPLPRDKFMSFDDGRF